MFVITRRFEWDMGHRVLEHEGKCRFLHGHRYRADVEFTAPRLDPLGRVIDFGVIKELVGTWIDNNLDHGCMVYDQDAELCEALGSMRQSKTFEVPFNPTAENIAKFLMVKFQRLLDQRNKQQHIAVSRVELYETPNCKATAVWYQDA